MRAIWNLIYCSTIVGLICSWLEIQRGQVKVDEITYPLIKHQPQPPVVIGRTSGILIRQQEGTPQNPLITIGRSKYWVIESQNETPPQHARNN